MNVDSQSWKLYAWDTRNRLESYSEPNMTNGNVVTVGSGAANYDYLPNGLGCTKIWDGNVEQVEIEEGQPNLSGFYDSNAAMNDNTTRYRYDGQMTIEEDVTFMDGNNQVVDQTSYLVGARGYEMIEAKRLAGPNASSFNKRSYPIYDGHGNMIATLAKVPGAGTPPAPGTYTIENVKKYDVWGAVRSSSGAGTHIVNPNKQYCANLGHTFDGESNLIYMRARYYEPGSGRFISEDPAGHGANWYTYCGNVPSVNHDESGTVFTNSSDPIRNAACGAFWIGSLTLVYFAMYHPSALFNPLVRQEAIMGACVLSGLAVGLQETHWAVGLFLGLLSSGPNIIAITAMATNCNLLARLPNGAVGGFWRAYNCALLAALILILLDSYSEANMGIVPGL